MKPTMGIYFDNAATTRPLPFDTDVWGNPSSPHSLGLAAERKLHEARQTLADILCCKHSEVFFTSGGTESNNIALLGLAYANRRKKITFLAQPYEHPSVLEPLKFIKEQGLGQVKIVQFQEENYQPIDTNQGLVVVAVSHVHHETGDIPDLQKIKSQHPKAVIFIDGAQGFCKENIPTRVADIYTFTGHKIHGGSGAGGLMVRAGIRLVPLMHGGGQEQKLRPGTENLQGILHMAYAADWLQKNNKTNHSHVTEIKKILQNVCGTTVNQSAQTSPYILNLSTGVKGEILVHALAEKGVYVSTGAACHSRKGTNTTLEAMGYPRERAETAIRLSFSHLNTQEEAYRAKKIIEDTIAELKKLLKGT